MCILTKIPFPESRDFVGRAVPLGAFLKQVYFHSYHIPSEIDRRPAVRRSSDRLLIFVSIEDLGRT